MLGMSTVGGGLGRAMGRAGAATGRNGLATKNTRDSFNNDRGFKGGPRTTARSWNDKFLLLVTRKAGVHFFLGGGLIRSFGGLRLPWVGASWIPVYNRTRWWWEEYGVSSSERKAYGRPEGQTPSIHSVSLGVGKSVSNKAQNCARYPLRALSNRAALVDPSFKRGINNAVERVDRLDVLEHSGVSIYHEKLYNLLQDLIRRKDVACGRQLRNSLLQQGLQAEFLFLVPSFIRLFALSGNLPEADLVFQQVSDRNLDLWCAIISAHASHGLGKHAFKLYQTMNDSGIEPNASVYAAVLQACARAGALVEGFTIHAQIKANGYEEHSNVGNSLVAMYAKLGRLHEAAKVFQKLSRKHYESWACMICGYAQHGHASEAVHLFKQMQLDGVRATGTIYASVFKACGSMEALDQGRQVHTLVKKSGFKLDVVVGTSLVDMYSKCGSLDEARKVFDNLPAKNIVSWTAMITGYAVHGDGHEALCLFRRMQQNGLKPNKVTFVSIFRACGSLGVLDEGKQVHAQFSSSGHKVDVVLGSALLNMYVKCGSMEEAQRIFDGLLERNVVSWTAMIAGYAHFGQGQKALELFRKMKQEGLKPNKITFVAILKACAGMGDLKEGRRIHAKLTESGCFVDAMVGNALVNMYAKCGSLGDAQNVFYQLPKQDVFSWAALITGYFQYGQGEKGHELLQQMLQEGMKPNRLTFTGILKACGGLLALDQGRQIHSLLIRIGLDSDIVIGTSLVDMYCKCESLCDARGVFMKLAKTDVILWNTMVGGHAHAGQVPEAIDLLQLMPQYGVRPNEITFLTLLKGCQGATGADHIKHIHTHVTQHGLEANGTVGSTLVDMYAKCGNLNEARKVFDKLLDRSVVSWTAMIGGYVQQGHGQEALQLFQQMENAQVEPDEVTFVNVLKACSSIAALTAGQAIHLRLLRSGFETDVFVGSTLIDMYAKCGCLELAREVFKKLPVKNVVSWNAIIGAYAQHGYAREALEHMQQMQKEGLRPNDVTFINGLAACSHAGLLPEGCMLFQSMLHDFFIDAGIEHNACIVDLLCRSGYVQAATEFMERLPLEPDVMMWLSVLGACRTHGNVGLGSRSFAEILKIDPYHSSAYVLMSRIYAEAGRLEEEAEIRKRMSMVGAVKEPGRTWMEVDNVVHSFVADDKEHSDRREIYAILTTLIKQ